MRPIWWRCPSTLPRRVNQDGFLVLGHKQLPPRSPDTHGSLERSILVRTPHRYALTRIRASSLCLSSRKFFNTNNYYANVIQRENNGRSHTHTHGWSGNETGNWNSSIATRFALSRFKNVFDSGKTLNSLLILLLPCRIGCQDDYRWDLTECSIDAWSEACLWELYMLYWTGSMLGWNRLCL